LLIFNCCNALRAGAHDDADLDECPSLARVIGG
jgi:hypothetical protein